MPQERSTFDPIDREVGSRIRLRRQMLHMSQKRLGSAIGVTYQQVQKYETGDSRVAASTLVAIARVLEWPTAAFLPSSEGPSPDAAQPWPEASTDGLKLLGWFQAVPHEFRPALVTICQGLAEPQG